MINDRKRTWKQLSVTEVKHIRESTLSSRELAVIYGKTARQIRYIRSNHSWNPQYCMGS